MLISLVIPCYNEEQVLADTYEKLISLSNKILANFKTVSSVEILFVDDGSLDNTWNLVSSFHGQDSISVRGIKLSRNFGHQHALLAGLESSRGDGVVSIDADLQDDLEVVPEMVRRFIEDGDQLVLGVRTDRATDSLFKRKTAQIYYRLLRALGDKTIPDHADFRLMSRKSIVILSQFSDRNLYLRGIVPLVGLQSSVIGYSRLPRLAGETKYSLRKMISLGWNGISNSSLWPLRAVSALGVLSLFATSAVIVWSVIVAIEGISIPGWASTITIISFLGGIQLLGIGVLGEYVGKVLVESKNRPLYIIDIDC